MTNSLALLADAGHVLSDVAALGLSLFAMRLARQPATTRRSYGYYRAEILAALTHLTQPRCSLDCGTHDAIDDAMFQTRYATFP